MCSKCECIPCHCNANTFCTPVATGVGAASKCCIQMEIPAMFRLTTKDLNEMCTGEWTVLSSKWKVTASKVDGPACAQTPASLQTIDAAQSEKQ